MSVPKSQRAISEVEYFNLAYKLSDDITKFLLSDFGTQVSNKQLNVFINQSNLDIASAAELRRLVTENRIGVEVSFPLWLLEHYRGVILDILGQLLNNITIGHTMYPNTMFEFNARRQYQDLAIANCYELKTQLQCAIRVLPVNLEKMVPYVELIDKEIDLLKVWRKDSNKFKKNCQLNDQRDKKIFEERFYKRLVAEYKDKELDDQKFIFSKYLMNEYQMYIDEYGRYCSTIPIPAMVMYNQGTTDYNIHNISDFCVG